MLLIVGTVRLPPDRLAAAREPMARMIDASRNEDGCDLYAYSVDVRDAGLIHVVERWRDRAALAAHVASSHLAEWRAAWPALGLGDRDRMLYEVAGEEPA